MVVTHPAPPFAGHSSSTTVCWPLIQHHRLVVTHPAPPFAGHSSSTTFWWSLIQHHRLLATHPAPPFGGHSSSTTVWWSLIQHHRLVVTHPAPPFGGDSSTFHGLQKYMIYRRCKSLNGSPAVTDISLRQCISTGGVFFLLVQQPPSGPWPSHSRGF